MYKLHKDRWTNQVTSVTKTNEDGSGMSSHFAPDNTDYQQFLKYQAEGGKVYGADEEIPDGQTS